mmetsp:Transcript_381/g.1092  ORF Transcript_381/g.1092 Transcript_381/m.1092 type:complete len:226 (-) Transcript_381:242-919(-)
MVLHGADDVDANKRQRGRFLAREGPDRVVGVGRIGRNDRRHRDIVGDIRFNLVRLDPGGFQLHREGFRRFGERQIMFAHIFQHSRQIFFVHGEVGDAAAQRRVFLHRQEIGVNVIGVDAVIDHRLALRHQRATGAAGLGHLADHVTFLRAQRHVQRIHRGGILEFTHVVDGWQYVVNRLPIQHETVILGRGQPQEHLRAPLVEVADLWPLPVIGIVAGKEHRNGR